MKHLKSVFLIPLLIAVWACSVPSIVEQQLSSSESSLNHDIPVYSDTNRVSLSDDDSYALVSELLGSSYLAYQYDSDIYWTEDKGSDVQDELDSELPDADWRLETDWSTFDTRTMSEWRKGDLQAYILILDNLNSDQISELSRRYGVSDLEPGSTLVITHVWNPEEEIPTATSTRTPIPSDTPTSTNTPTSTVTFTPSATFTATVTPTNTLTPTPLPGAWSPIGLSEDAVTNILVVNNSLWYASTYGLRHGIFKSTDQGISWQAINNGLGSLDIFDIDVLSNSNNSLLAATTEGLWFTSDGGETWQPYGPEVTIGSRTFSRQDERMVSVAILPADPTKIIVVEGNDVSLSSDGGNIWEEISGNTWERVVAANTPSQTFYLTSESFINRTDNAGIDWVEGASVGADYDIGSIAVDPGNKDVVYACTGTFSIYRGLIREGFGVYKSTDGSGSWTPINDGLPNTGFESECSAVEVNPSDSANVFVAISGQVYVSYNSGETWELFSNPRLPEEVWPIYKFAIDPISNVICAGTTQGIWCNSLE